MPPLTDRKPRMEISWTTIMILVSKITSIYNNTSCNSSSHSVQHSPTKGLSVTQVNSKFTDGTSTRLHYVYFPRFPFPSPLVVSLSLFPFTSLLLVPLPLLFISLSLPFSISHSLFISFFFLALFYSLSSRTFLPSLLPPFFLLLFHLSSCSSP